MAEVKIYIDGKEVLGFKGQTVLDIARENNIEIPTLCHDDRIIEAYGACGLCIVEIEGLSKSVRACITEAKEGMVVLTNTPQIRESRKIILELLLSNHIGDCRPPCVLACPANTDCQGYVGLIANGEYEEALKLIKEQLPLPASIGRICPHPCEEACRRELVEEPIAIAWLKRFVADIDLKSASEFIPDIKAKTGKNIAIVGGGPSGLTAAYYLAIQGHKVRIYEAMPQFGGMLRYGIPEYRLPGDVLDKEIGIISRMGVEMLANTKVGRDLTLKSLYEKYDAVYVSVGAWDSIRLNCPGEEFKGVIGGVEFLREFSGGKVLEIGNRVAVIGGGNTAMDACRTAIRMGAKEVYVLYRRTQSEMPAKDVEIAEAMEEGVQFQFLVSPIEILGEENRVTGIRLQRMELGEADSRGRRVPLPIDGSEELLDVDTVIVAIGQSVNTEGLEGLELTREATIYADKNSLSTNLPKVFAGGDGTNKGPGIAIEAIAEGKRASEMICRYLQGEALEDKELYYAINEEITAEDFKDRPKQYRPPMPQLSAQSRKSNFTEIIGGYDEKNAVEEASRCLECGCGDYFECKLFQLANEYDLVTERFKGESRKNKIRGQHPFIKRDPNKCVLCGLCVRACDEIVGIGALGLANRGFNTIAGSAFNIPLEETNCISCGQCIDVCPTGALQEKLSMDKDLPLETELTTTICGHCSVGCSMEIHTRGEILVKATPSKAGIVNQGLACARGKFGFDVGHGKDRITSPMIRQGGRLEEVSWQEAISYIANRVKEIGSNHGRNSIGLSISDRYTNEEIYLISKLAKEVLKTNHICSFNRISGGIEEVLGYDGSSSTYDDLLTTDTIILVASDIMKEHTVVATKIKRAVENGAKLIVINPFESQADEWAYKKVTPANNSRFLMEVIKILLEEGCKTKEVNGLEDLQESLQDIVAGKDAREVARIYGQSKKAMIVFAEKNISPDGAKLLANMAVISGHIGAYGRGILQMGPNCNSQGLKDMGIKGDRELVLQGIRDQDIRALLVFGEDISHTCIGQLDFLMVQDIYMTPIAEKADVVLPGASFLESRGSFTNSEARVQKVNQVLEPAIQYENWQIVSKLAKAIEPTTDYGKLLDICYGIEEKHILYEKGFNFPDKKARLQIAQEGPLFSHDSNSNKLVKKFNKKLYKE